MSASPWANPFRVRDCATIFDCLQKFEAHLLASPRLLDRLPELAGRRLVCHCRGNAPCHADVLIQAFRNMVGDTEIAAATVLVGVFYSKAEFVEAARMCTHPFEAFYAAPLVVNALRHRMQMSTAELVAYRRAVLAHWRGRAAALEEREADLHARMSPDVRTVMKGKLILLLGEMLRVLDFPSTDDLLHCLSAGFPLVGDFPVTGIFPAADRRALYSITELWQASSRVQRDVAAQASSSGRPDDDDELEQLTLGEVKRGWLQGPFTSDELTRMLGCWLPSRRFGVRQGGKLRAVDDYSASLVNSGLSATETIDPGDLDHIAANVRAHMAALCAPESLRPAASPFEGIERHPDVQGDELRGRLWDLEKAYRQLARHPKHAALAVVACWCPSRGELAYFTQAALPFGAAASVLGFNWAATALSVALTGLFRIGSTNLYDDFCVLERPRLLESADEATAGFFDLLGWRLKDTPNFSAEPAPLGAVLDLSRAHDGVAYIRNKPERVAEISACIDAILEGSPLAVEALPKLRGRLLFARSLCFGRFGAAALRTLNDACGCRVRAPRPTEELKQALRNLRSYLVTAPPRAVRLAHASAPLLFTDGSFEPNAAGAPEGLTGGVLLDPRDGAYFFFSLAVPGPLLAQWLRVSGNPIAQIEAFAVLIALGLWSERLAARSTLAFVDNEAVRASLVAGGSSAAQVAAVVSAAIDLEIASGALLWFERVPSESNLADPPSRGDRPPALKGWAEPRKFPPRGVGLVNALRVWGLRGEH